MQDRVDMYAKQAWHYLENASAMLQSGELEKASEFLWGSMAEALKGVAARKERLLRNHREIRDYARLLSDELQDPTIETAYITADQLHSNYYESFLDAEDLSRNAERIRQAVAKLLGLLDVPWVEPSRT